MKRVLVIASLFNVLLIPCIHAQDGVEQVESTQTVARSTDENLKATSQSSSLASGEQPEFIEPIVFRWKVGVRIEGGTKSCSNLLITIPIPTNWPEQTVTVFEQNVPLSSREFQIREGNSGLQQMVATIPKLNANQEVEFEMVFNVQVHKVKPPESPHALLKPKHLDRDMRVYLDASPGISFTYSKLRKQLKEIVENCDNPWDEAKAIYSWIIENIENNHAMPTEALDCFKNRAGGPEDIVGLFVAMCRLNKIPSRTVWVDGTQYAEFYLENEDKEGFWYPVVLTGIPEFAANSDPRIIMQKGDSIRVPEKNTPLRFVNEFVTAEGTSNASKPKVEFIRELVTIEVK
ncbi:MAG: transglutaminase domain-containing protein [Pirellulaceae bacterium]